METTKENKGIEAKSWLWPDREIGKRESRRLREEHNALVNLCGLQSDLIACAQALVEFANSNTRVNLTGKLGEAVRLARKACKAGGQS